MTVVSPPPVSHLNPSPYAAPASVSLSSSEIFCVPHAAGLEPCVFITSSSGCRAPQYYNRLLSSDSRERARVREREHTQAWHSRSVSRYAMFTSTR